MAVSATQKYAAIVVVIVAVLAALVVFISQQPGGYIETQGGSTCSWRLQGDPYTNRTVLFDCQCPSGKKYSCKYYGRPEITCPPFWRDFWVLFKQIRQAAAGENHACDLAEINWGNVPLCKDSKSFKMERIGTPSKC